MYQSLQIVSGQYSALCETRGSTKRIFHFLYGNNERRLLNTGSESVTSDRYYPSADVSVVRNYGRESCILTWTEIVLSTAA